MDVSLTIDGNIPVTVTGNFSGSILSLSQATAGSAGSSASSGGVGITGIYASGSGDPGGAGAGAPGEAGTSGAVGGSGQGGGIYFRGGSSTGLVMTGDTVSANLAQGGARRHGGGRRRGSAEAQASWTRQR